ncbi:hypothetical protein F0562_015171 [Nyssa sinensis]|uniref:Uncharacterized protein n=1 Tax=Nyssa sinensis TaxID=561372 RepID=A0A5J4ZK84_9ASTE|nr:hypothetical protein F0562_015171 [Nyssa sinensis]
MELRGSGGAVVVGDGSDWVAGGGDGGTSVVGDRDGGMVRGLEMERQGRRWWQRLGSLVVMEVMGVAAEVVGCGQRLVVMDTTGALHA